MSVRASDRNFTSNRLIRESLFIGGPLLLFGALLAAVIQWAPTRYDRTALEYVQAIPWGVFEFIPQFGSDVGGGPFGFYILPALVSAFFIARRQWHLLGLVAALFILHFALISPKVFIEAYRPSPEFGVQGDGGLMSFPSGHVQWAVSFYGLLAYLVWQRTSWLIDRSNLTTWIMSRLAVGTVFTTVVFLTMIGRMGLGRHWPIDVAAGVLAGFIALRMLILVHEWLGSRAAIQRSEGHRDEEFVLNPGGMQVGE